MKQTEAALNQLVITYERAQEKLKPKEEDPFKDFLDNLKDFELAAEKLDAEMGMFTDAAIQTAIDAAYQRKQIRDQEDQEISEMLQNRVNESIAADVAMSNSNERKV